LEDILLVFVKNELSLMLKDNNDNADITEIPKSKKA
tara:strand:+ start:216 stop:323 length:108 start_codon:yes stop_codon:yes gene_type:complete